MNQKQNKTVLNADEMGFCLGVRRAVGSLEDAVAAAETPVYTLGPIIHNPQVIRDFAGQGVVTAETPEEIPPGSTVVIRAHGVPPAILERLEKRNLRIIDGTCPRVISSQKTVRKYSEQGYQIVIVGDADHGEIIGLAGYADHPMVISTPEEAVELNLKGKVMVISQTTIKQDEYDRVCEVLKRKCEELKVVNSICSATSDRQQALRELCARVDACLIIGGRNSANTRRLFMTAAETGIPVWHIQDETEIPAEIAPYERIGLSAGASTPDRVIRRVRDALLSQ